MPNNYPPPTSTRDVGAGVVSAATNTRSARLANLISTCLTGSVRGDRVGATRSGQDHRRTVQTPQLCRLTNDAHATLRRAALHRTQYWYMCIYTHLHILACFYSFEHISAVSSMFLQFWGHILVAFLQHILDADSIFWHILAVFGMFLQFWVCFCSFELYLAIFGYLKSSNPDYLLPKNVLETRIATRTKSETKIWFLKILRDIFCTRNCYIFCTQNLSKYEPTNFIWNKNTESYLKLKQKYWIYKSVYFVQKMFLTSSMLQTLTKISEYLFFSTLQTLNEKFYTLPFRYIYPVKTLWNFSKLLFLRPLFFRPLKNSNLVDLLCKF